MKDLPSISESEFDLLVELLEHEQAELPKEIRHTRTRTFRAELRERLALVESLRHKLRTGEGHEHARGTAP